MSFSFFYNEFIYNLTDKLININVKLLIKN